MGNIDCLQEQDKARKGILLRKPAGRTSINILLPSSMQSCKELCVTKTDNSVIICQSIIKMLKYNAKKKRQIRDDISNLMLSSEEQMTQFCSLQSFLILCCVSTTPFPAPGLRVWGSNYAVEFSVWGGCAGGVGQNKLELYTGTQH